MGERFKLIAEGLDVAPLLAKLAEHPELWAENTERQNYPGSAHKDTETIYLRWATDRSLFGAWHCLESEDMPAALDMYPEIAQVVQAVIVRIFGGVLPAPFYEIGRVILTRLKPGGVITEHVDEGPYADHFERFHLCLAGDMGTHVFRCGGAEWYPEPGSLLWFNHKLPHSVENRGAKDRIHLIIDCVAPEYRKLRGLTFQRERAMDLWDEIMPLLEKHYREICHYKDLILKPDVDGYNAIEAAGNMRCYTARLNGDLIGYCVFFLKHNLHYRDSFQAIQDVLFILPEHRGSRAGLKLIRYCEDRLREEGIQVVYQHLKVSTPKTIELFRKMGYEEIDMIMGKRLDR